MERISCLFVISVAAISCQQDESAKIKSHLSTCEQPGVVLASDQRAPAAISTDDHFVYWINLNDSEQTGQGLLQDGFNGEIMRADKCTGETLTIADGLTNPQLYSLALDNESVYWTSLGTQDAIVHGTNDGKVLKVAKEGGPLITVAEDQAQPRGIAIQSGQAYWTVYPLTQDGYMIAKGAGDGSTPVQYLLKRDNQESINRNLVVDGETVYWISTHNIYTGSTEGGDYTRFATGYPNNPIAQDKDFIYSTIRVTLTRTSKATGEEKLLKLSAPAPFYNAIAVDDSFIYVAQRDISRKYQVEKRDKNSFELIKTYMDDSTGPFQIAVDEDYLYVTAQNSGIVHRLSK
ncbi:MAG: hypothetical protein AB7T49_14410 [Oligoflexales bacterium]